MSSSQSVQGNTHSRAWRVPSSHSYDQSSSCNITSHHQSGSSFQTHAPLASESSLRSQLYDSPASTYSGLSWSGSSNTQERSSPVTPEFSHSPWLTIASHNETPTAAFLSESRDSDEATRLDFLRERDGRRIRSKRLPELPGSCITDDTRSGEAHLSETPTSTPPECGSWHTLPDIRKSRRFCRDFGFSLSNPILARAESSTHSPSSPTFPLDSDLIPPLSRSSVSKLFSEKETAAVREFLRVWGSNNRVKVTRSRPTPDEDGGLGGDNDYLWETSETDDSIWDPAAAQCSMLLHEVGDMVGLPPEQLIMEDQCSVASTPPAPSTLDRLTQNNQGISHSLDFPSSYQSAALVRCSISDGDDFDVEDGEPSSTCQHVDQPLDVAPSVSGACGLLARSGTSTPRGKDETVDVPVILASSTDATPLKDTPCDLLLNRRLSPGKARSADGNIRRHGQVFDVEEAWIPAASSPIAVHRNRAFVPTREPPPLPPLPGLSAKHVSALDFSLSRLKAHESQRWMSGSMEEADVRRHASSKDRAPPPSTTSRERKHQSGVTPRTAYPRSIQGRHFSSPMPEGAPGRRTALRPVTEPIDAHLRVRAAKLFPCPENRESMMRSFMEMDVVPPKATAPRRSSRLGRAAARWSRGIANFGKIFTASKSIKECA